MAARGKPETEPTEGTLSFGPFRIDIRNRRLTRGGRVLLLTPKEFDTLAVLVGALGRLVSKEDLILRVWNDCQVGDGSLARNVSVLRRRLGADIIETIPRVGYRLSIPVSVSEADETRSSPSQDGIRSIAVLPFASLGPDKRNEYYGEGLAEDIIRLLSRIPGLRVIAKTSAFLFAPDMTDLRGLSERLNVAAVLKGTIRTEGDRIRVTTQFIDCYDSRCLWAEKYDRRLDDIFAIQDDISQAVAEALRLRLIARPTPVNTEAYKHYLCGQYQRLRATPASLAEAKTHFEKAIAIDPEYSLAYSGLADHYYSFISFGIKNTRDVADLAKWSAKKALTLDEGNSEAHSILASLAAICDYDWPETERQFRLAMAGESVPGVIRFRYALYGLCPFGRLEEAIEQSLLALDADPLSMLLHFGAGYTLYVAANYEGAIEHARVALRIDDRHYLMLTVLGLAQLEIGSVNDAIANLEAAFTLAPWFSVLGSALAIAYRRGARHSAADALCQKLAGTNGIFLYYAAFGMTEKMFSDFSRLIAERDRAALLALNLPFFNGCRDHPRFLAALRDMNLDFGARGTSAH